jgi:hypothetical protein
MIGISIRRCKEIMQEGISGEQYAIIAREEHDVIATMAIRGDDFPRTVLSDDPFTGMLDADLGSRSLGLAHEQETTCRKCWRQAYRLAGQWRGYHRYGVLQCDCRGIADMLFVPMGTDNGQRLRLGGEPSLHGRPETSRSWINYDAIPPNPGKPLAEKAGSDQQLLVADEADDKTTAQESMDTTCGTPRKPPIHGRDEQLTGQHPWKQGEEPPPIYNPKTDNCHSSRHRGNRRIESQFVVHESAFFHLRQLDSFLHRTLG